MEALEEKLQTLSISRRSRTQNQTYVLDVALQPSGLLAVSCSDLTVRLHSKETLSLVAEQRGHRGALCGVLFSRTSPHLLYSGSADGTVRVWDVREAPAAAAQLFRSDPSHVYCSFDLNAGDTLLCAGTEKVDDEDSFLVFWDVRKPGAAQPLGVYSESHSDDITQVRFHPVDRNRLATGSTDGLVNVFDLSRGAEDDALLATCNSDSSAGAICWCGADYGRLLCLSHDQGLHLWDLQQLHTDQPLAVFSTRDARGLGGALQGSLDYLVGGAWLEEAGRLLVVGGQSGEQSGGQNGEQLHLLECDGEGLRLLGSLRGGHTSTVRCFSWDAAQEALVTGGEDGQLLLWTAAGGGTEEVEEEEKEKLALGRKESAKSQSALRLKSRPHRKHSYHRDRKPKGKCQNAHSGDL